MIIKDKNKLFERLKIKAQKRYFAVKLLIILCLIITSLFLIVKGSTLAKNKGFTGLTNFITTVTTNYLHGRKAHPESISIIINTKNLKKLEKNREHALQRGLIINDLDGEYVSATLEYKGEKLDVKLRLKGHMTDHLQKDKWSFRIKVKGNNEFMGMKRFSIQHPGTRGYIYEWIYHELMKQEDIIALRYKFINVIVNGKDWGIYAVEENFENELIANNHRIAGPILRFNPDLYWVNRRSELERTNSYDEYASYYSANPEAYREDKILQDSVQKGNYLKALALMEGLRNKQIKVNEAFDIERLAKFHALIDLIGGVHSIDWSDVKYYYNPLTNLLEPIAYESFTSLTSRDLSSLYKYVSENTNYYDWHSMIFSNPVFFAEYMKQLEKMTTPAYLTEFFDKVRPQLLENLAILYKEFPYKNFEKQDYFNRQEMIKKIINPPKALHAFLNRVESNTVILKVGAIDALPVRVLSINVKNNRSEDLQNTILPAKQNGQFIIYKDITFIMPEGFEWKNEMSDSIYIQYQILGASQKKQAAVFPYPYTDGTYLSDELKEKKSNVTEFPFLSVDEKAKLIMCMPGKHLIDRTIVIPAGYRLMANTGVNLNFRNHAKLVSFSPLFFTGTADAPIIIEFDDLTFQGIKILNSEKSILNYVVIRSTPSGINNGNAAVVCYESSIEFKHCSFYKCPSKKAVHLVRCDFSFTNCNFRDMVSDAISLDFSNGFLTDCTFENCFVVMDITESKVNIKNINITGTLGKALNLKEGGQLTGNSVKINQSIVALSASGFATIELKDLSLDNCEVGLMTNYGKLSRAFPSLKINGFTMQNVKRKYILSKGAEIILNGKMVKEETSDANAERLNDKDEID